ncbi:MAG TPA: hypothetical protein VGL23_10365 [Chloroflexota bacterium]|jgi:ATP-binding cassette subfamily B protein
MLGKGWDDGVELSGGPWQTLALGRAMMRREPLLVVELGSHHELVQRGGLYAELYGLQSRIYR